MPSLKASDFIPPYVTGGVPNTSDPTLDDIFRWLDAGPFSVSIGRSNEHNAHVWLRNTEHRLEVEIKGGNLAATIKQAYKALQP